MNETIFDTFTPDNKNCSKEMEMQVQLHEREVQELNESHRSAVDTYEKQVRERMSVAHRNEEKYAGFGAQFEKDN